MCSVLRKAAESQNKSVAIMAKPTTRCVAPILTVSLWTMRPPAELWEPSLTWPLTQPAVWFHVQVCPLQAATLSLHQVSGVAPYMKRLTGVSQQIKLHCVHDIYVASWAVRWYSSEDWFLAGAFCVESACSPCACMMTAAPSGQDMHFRLTGDSKLTVDVR